MRLFVNPMAGSGGVRRTASALAAQLRANGVAFDVVETAAPGDATGAARRALQEGVRLLVAVGGDGTCHEVVNGMFDLPSPEAAATGAVPAPVAPDAVLAVVPAGSGCDFARTFRLRRGRRAVAPHLDGAATRRIDVGFVSCTGADGHPVGRVFLNVAEVGYGAEVARRAAGYPRPLGRFRYLVGAYGALRSLTREEAVLRVGTAEDRVPLVELVVANGRFFGGGMKVAPGAEPDDGTFAVLAFTGHRGQVILLTPKIFAGRHVPHPQIREYDAPLVEVTPRASLLVEADGEVVGRSPATFTVVPRALALKV